MEILDRIVAIAEENEIGIREHDVGGRDGMALLDPGGGMSVAVHPRIAKGPKTRAARVIGHEVGHCMTGSFYAKQLAFPNIGQCERKATKWYVDEALDEDALRRALKKTDDNYWEVADELGVDIHTVIDACDVYFHVEPAAIRARLGLE